MRKLLYVSFVEEHIEEAGQMNIHGNARLTPHSREVISRASACGCRRAGLAVTHKVFMVTVQKWFKRYREEGVNGLQDRSSRPHKLRAEIPPATRDQVEELRHQRLTFHQIAAQTAISVSSVARICKSAGLSRLKNLEPKEQIIRYEKEKPGEMIHIDIKKLGRIEGFGHRITNDRTGQSAPRSRKTGGKGWEYLHLAVDDHSRLAWSQILPDETRKSCLKFLFNALRFYKKHGVKVQQVMTDNGTSFRSCRYARALKKLNIKHRRTRPYTPKTNGKAERFVQTSLREWAYAKPYIHSDERQKSLLPFLNHYNYHRKHFGINQQTPCSRLNANNLSNNDS